MTSTTGHLLEQLEQLLGETCAAVEREGRFEDVPAAGLVGMLQAAGRVQRSLDAIVTAVADAVVDRDLGPSAERVSARAGCRDATELLRRTLRVDTGTARRFVHAAAAVHRERNLSGGELRPAPYAALAQALRDGDLSVAGLLAAVTPVEKAGNRIGAAEREAADRLLADAARGLDIADEHGRPGPPPTTDELGALAQSIMLALDPDGRDPEDVVASRRRGISLGRIRDGLVPVSGVLLPDVAGALQRLLDALLNPRVEDPAEEQGVRFQEPGDPDDLPDPVDARTPAQKRHDAFATIVNAAAASGRMPALGGAAPTLVVSVSATDFTAGTGRAFIEGTGWEVPIDVARQTACAGGIQRVLFDEHGQIVSIGTTARIFTAVQRRAIVLRDRECVIPGCHVPATWCEIHHVTEWAQGGRTHTSNGAALCWHHHRTLDTSGWHIRMRQGVPEIRGPAWWDPHGGWHRPRIRGGDPAVAVLDRASP